MRVIVRVCGVGVSISVSISISVGIATSAWVKYQPHPLDKRGIMNVFMCISSACVCPCVCCACACFPGHQQCHRCAPEGRKSRVLAS